MLHGVELLQFPASAPILTEMRARLAWLWGVLGTLAILLPAVPIVAGFLITSGQVNAARRASTFLPAQDRSKRPPAGTAIPSGTGALVAVIVHATAMRSAPAGRQVARIGLKTDFGSPTAMWVVAQSPGWLGVISPAAGNGKVGWIPQDAATLTRVPIELRVSLSSHKLTVLESGKVIQQYTVAVGRPDAPTPTGRFDVTDRLLTGDPAGPYGCCVLALSAVAPHAISDWTGGDRVAIHSTTETSSIGFSVTHGCVRVTLDHGRWLLAHVPLGTPTVISA